MALFFNWPCAAETVVFRFDQDSVSGFYLSNPTGLFRFEVANGVLRLSKPTDTAADEFRGGAAYCMWRWEGDFDVSVKYQLNSPLMNGDQLEFHLHIANSSWFIVRSNEEWLGGDNYHVWLPDSNSATPQIQTLDTDGILRFVRTNTTLTAYFRSGASTEDRLLYTATVGAETAFVSMHLQNQPFSHSALNASFDDLSLAAQQILVPIRIDSLAPLDSHRLVLAWEPGHPDVRFVVEGCTSLSNPTWAAVEPTNQWPVSATTWTFDPARLGPTFFLRVRKY